MRDFPLLDLRDTWRDLHRALDDAQAQAEALWYASTFTWLDMMILRQRVLNARVTLGTMPSSLLDEIAADEADLREREDRTDAAS